MEMESRDNQTNGGSGELDQISGVMTDGVQSCKDVFNLTVAGMLKY